MSPPARGRGLKLIDKVGGIAAKRSPPARGRGLKRFRGVSHLRPKVAPRAGAWIETIWTASHGIYARRPPRGGVD